MEKKKGFIAEFKEFALRGSVMDLAVGVIIGAAFQAIVNSSLRKFHHGDHQFRADGARDIPDRKGYQHDQKPRKERRGSGPDREDLSVLPESDFDQGYQMPTLYI